VARFACAGVDIAPQTLGRSVAVAIDLLMPVASASSTASGGGADSPGSGDRAGIAGSELS